MCSLELLIKLHGYISYQLTNVSNPLTTDDAFWRRQILAACYQLAQSVLKIGSALAERVGQGEVGGYTPLADSAWWRLQLPVWVGYLSAFSHQRV